MPAALSPAPFDDHGDTRRRMLIVAGVATVLACLIVLGTSVQNFMELTLREGETISLLRLARWPATFWAFWVLLAPLCFELAWRVRLTREAWVVPTLVLLLGNAASFVVDVAMQVASMYLPIYSMIHPDLADAVQYHTLNSLYLNVFVFWFIVATAHGLRLYRDAQRQALRAAQLEGELTRARLDALKMQLHPHFLFNTLHGISTLMYRDVATADRMVTRLSRLLRRTLDRSNAHEVTLREELEVLTEYLAIEELRFSDGLQVRYDVVDGLGDVLVPSFVFQPLVENALKHGIAPHSHAGTITIEAGRDAGGLRLAVTDDGPGLSEGDTVLGAGVGLSNLHDRLQRLYGTAFTLALEDAEPHGLRVVLTLPLRRSPHEDAARPSTAPLVPSALNEPT